MDEEYQIYIGIDWGTEAYQVCTLDGARRVCAERVVEHSGTAIAQFVESLLPLCGGDPARAAVAIEMPRGTMVETLVERGFAVYALNPKQLDRFRDRHTVAGAKDDRRDAFVLADSLRTDRPCFRRVQLDDPLIIQLRELSRIEDDLREEFNRLTNRLREQLHRFFPQPLRLVPATDEPWLWALLELVPTPAAARTVRPRRLEKLLAAHRIRRVHAPEVLAILQAPALHVAPGVVEAAAAHVALLLPRLQLVHAQRAACAGTIEQLLTQLSAPAADPADQGREPRDVEILRSLPGVGRVVAATVLAEAAGPLAARDYHALRAHAGVAPVTRQSGKKRVVVMRQGCSGRLRYACYHWGRVAAQVDPPSRQYYAALRGRGKTHGHAVRMVTDRLLRVLTAMLKTRTLYTLRTADPVPPGPLTEAIAS